MDTGLNPERPFWRREAAALAALSVLYWVLVAVTWGRVSDAGSDAFHELTTVFRMESGQSLYGDIQYLHGPVAPYLLYLFRRVFGPDVQTHLLLCSLLAWLEWLLVWRLARLAMSLGTCLGLLATVWLQFTFAPGLFGRLLPYSLGALTASVLILAVMAILAGREISPRRLWGAALFAGAALLSKFEIGFAAWLMTAGTAWLGVRSRKCSPVLAASVTLLPWCLWISAEPVLPGFLRMTSPGPVFASDLGRTYLVYGGSLLTAEAAAHFALTLAASTAAALFLLRATGWIREGDFRFAAFAALVAAGTPVVLNLALPLGSELPFGVRLAQHLSWAFLVPALIHAGITGLREDQPVFGPAVYLGLLALLIRTPNTLQPYLYGSFYLLPAVAVIAPGLTGLAGSLGRDRLKIPAGAAALLLLVVSLPAGWRNFQTFAGKTFPLEGRAAPLRTTPVKGPVLNDALDYLKQRLKPGDRIAVVPNEPVFYYATGALPVWPDHNYIGHLVRGDDETRLAGLAMAQARFVVFSNRPYIEFGAARAGLGFADVLKARLEREAKLAAVFSDQPDAPDAPRGYVDGFYRIWIWEIPQADGR